MLPQTRRQSAPSDAAQHNPWAVWLIHDSDDRALLTVCAQVFSTQYGQMLGQYLQMGWRQPPIQQTGMTDPRGNLLRASAAGNDEALAFTDLILGQVRLSWRLADAWDLLASGLQGASRWAGPKAYLQLQRELDQLKSLPLLERPREKPQSWPALLREAKVVGYLRTGRV